MDYPTFGGEDGKLVLCVQSLDRRCELPKAQDRHKVLINRVPKRHRSITAMNFFASPPTPSNTSCIPPVPSLPSTVVPAKRPAPKFLEVFTPLSTEEKTVLAGYSSTVSTPSTTASSIPVTPSSPRQELHPANPPNTRVSKSYFLLPPSGRGYHHHERNPTWIPNVESATETIHAVTEQQQPLKCSDIVPDDSERVAHDWDMDQQNQRNVDELYNSISDDRSLCHWATRPEHPEHKIRHSNALMMDGTFGRI